MAPGVIVANAACSAGVVCLPFTPTATQTATQTPSNSATDTPISTPTPPAQTPTQTQPPTPTTTVAPTNTPTPTLTLTTSTPTTTSIAAPTGTFTPTDTPMASGATTGTPTATQTPTPGPEDGGFVPLDDNTEDCAALVGKNVYTLTKCVTKCHIKAAKFALQGLAFDEEACENTDPTQSCRAKYDAATNKLVAKGICPSCLDTTHQAAIADQTEVDLDEANKASYCAGSVGFDGDDSGFVPPDSKTAGCEAMVASSLSKLRMCIIRCHIKAADYAFRGLVFDEEACESRDPRKSCRAKYNATGATLLAKGTCPACLDSAHQASLADQAENDLDAGNGALYCAGTVPFTP